MLGWNQSVHFVYANYFTLLLCQTINENFKKIEIPNKICSVAVNNLSIIIINTSYEKFKSNVNLLNIKKKNDFLLTKYITWYFFSLWLSYWPSPSLTHSHTYTYFLLNTLNSIFLSKNLHGKKYEKA